MNTSYSVQKNRCKDRISQKTLDTRIITPAYLQKSWREMNESLLIKICLVSVIVGIAIMFFSSIIIKPKEIKIEEISEKNNHVKNVCYEYIPDDLLEYELLKMLTVKFLNNEIDEQTFLKLRNKLKNQ